MSTTTRVSSGLYGGVQGKSDAYLSNSTVTRHYALRVARVSNIRGTLIAMSRTFRDCVAGEEAMAWKRVRANYDWMIDLGSS